MNADEKDRAKSVRCPNCNAAPGALCTAPTETGRRDVQYVHFARLAEYQKESY